MKQEAETGKRYVRVLRGTTNMNQKGKWLETQKGEI